MMNDLIAFFDRSGFMPHGACISWRPDLVLLHAASDALIALSYYSIPVALLYFADRRRDVEFRWVFVLFGLFILACGTTHMLGVWTLWYPDYAFDGMVKAFTAAVSLATAIALWKIMPAALAIPGKTELAIANRALAAEIADRRSAEATVRGLNATLELRVLERTRELEKANRDLQSEIAERQRTEARNRLLIDELNHRVKNTLASVRSLMAVSLEKGDRLEMRRVFDGRLQALAVAHELLTESAWEGADLRTVIERELAPYRRCDGDGDGVRLDGPSVCVPPRVAMAAAMTLHELATNAVKHGALSVPGGWLEITWTVVVQHGRQRLILTWRERGGPPVQPPSGTGFGARLITGRVPYELGGTCTLDFDPDGVVCRIEMPLDAAAPIRAESGREPSGERSTDVAEGRRHVR